MLKLKDLQNRVYSGKVCTRFECKIPIDKDKSLLAMFIREFAGQVCSDMWRMQVVTDRTRDKDSEVYNFTYVMPKSNLPLELIAATGLRYFQLHLKEEIQNKSNLDFVLGDILSGM